ALLFPTIRRGVEQHRCTLVFAVAVEPAVRVGQRAFAELPLLAADVSGEKVLTDPALALRVAVEVFADEHHAAVVVDHVLVGVDLLGLERAAGVRADLEEGTAGSVARTDVDIILVHDGSRDGGGAARACKAPEQSAAVRRNPSNTLARHLHVLPDAPDRGDH